MRFHSKSFRIFLIMESFNQIKTFQVFSGAKVWIFYSTVTYRNGYITLIIQRDIVLMEQHERGTKVYPKIGK